MLLLGSLWALTWRKSCLFCTGGLGVFLPRYRYTCITTPNLWREQIPIMQTQLSPAYGRVCTALLSSAARKANYRCLIRICASNVQCTVEKVKNVVSSWSWHPQSFFCWMNKGPTDLCNIYVAKFTRERPHSPWFMAWLEIALPKIYFILPFW